MLFLLAVLIFGRVERYDEVSHLTFFGSLILERFLLSLSASSSRRQCRNHHKTRSRQCSSASGTGTSKKGISKTLNGSRQPTETRSWLTSRTTEETLLCIWQVAMVTPVSLPESLLKETEKSASSRIDSTPSQTPRKGWKLVQQWYLELACSFRLDEVRAGGVVEWDKFNRRKVTRAVLGLSGDIGEGNEEPLLIRHSIDLNLHPSSR